MKHTTGDIIVLIHNSFKRHLYFWNDIDGNEEKFKAFPFLFLSPQIRVLSMVDIYVEFNGWV